MMQIGCFKKRCKNGNQHISMEPKSFLNQLKRNPETMSAEVTSTIRACRFHRTRGPIQYERIVVSHFEKQMTPTGPCPEGPANYSSINYFNI